VSDVYSMAMLVRWALSGTRPPSADDRLASQARRDEDPLVPVADAIPGLDDAVGRLLDSALRLHPATRPQSISELADALKPHAEASPAAAPPPLPQSPWSGPSKDTDGPPPLPTGRPRPGGVPPVPKGRRTSSIGEAPPPVPGSTGSKSGRRRKIGLGTIVSFIIALAIAWMVASGGPFATDEPEPTGTPTERVGPTEVEIEDAPRKGPTNSAREDTGEPSSVGVREQVCNSRFVFETARDAGANALRAYLEQCDGFSSDYVEAARDALGLN
jgi:hypothetical protein